MVAPTSAESTVDERPSDRRRLLRAALGFALLIVPAAFSITVALAETYPSRPVRMVVPFNPGAGLDIVARIVANALSEQSAKPVVVENRPGGGGLIGAEGVAKSEPDGYTLLFSPDDLFTIVPHLSQGRSFDPNRQLTPVIAVGQAIDLIVMNPAIPAQTLPELIGYARSHPNALSYGSNGQGSATQLAIETLKSRAKIDILHVPYKGKAQAVLATVSGEVQLTIIGYGTASDLIDAGKLRAIVVAGSQREPGLPNLPTTAEFGYPDVDYATWFTISTSAATPRDIVHQVSDAFSRVLKSPQVRKQLAERYVIVTDIGPDQTAQTIANRFQVNGEAVRRFATHLD